MRVDLEGVFQRQEAQRLDSVRVTAGRLTCGGRNGQARWRPCSSWSEESRVSQCTEGETQQRNHWAEKDHVTQQERGGCGQASTVDLVSSISVHSPKINPLLSGDSLSATKQAVESHYLHISSALKRIFEIPH